MKIGTDIIQISRIEKSLEKFGDKFKAKFIAKALGCGIGADLSFHDISIKKNERGAPSFILSPDAQKIHAVASSSLSISHDGGFAIAVVAIT